MSSSEYFFNLILIWLSLATELFFDGQYVYMRQTDDIDSLDPSPVFVLCDNNAFNQNNSQGFESTFKFLLGESRTKMGWEMAKNNSFREG